MTDQNPFGGSAGTAVAEPAQEEAPEASGRPKPVVLAVAGAVLLVLAVAAYFLVFSGGGDGSSDAGAVVPGRTVASGSPSGVGPSPTPSVAVAVVSGNKVAGLDPFRAPPQASASNSPTTAARTSGRSVRTRNMLTPFSAPALLEVAGTGGPTFTAEPQGIMRPRAPSGARAGVRTRGGFGRRRFESFPRSACSHDTGLGATHGSRAWRWIGPLRRGARNPSAPS